MSCVHLFDFVVHCPTLSYLYYITVVFLVLFLLRHRLLDHDHFVLHHPSKVYVEEVDNWYCILGKFFAFESIIVRLGAECPM